jgi:hypothetical protein
MTGDRTHVIGTEHMDLPELRVVMENDGALWSGLLAHGLDPNAMVKEIDADDGFERDATTGIRLAQALHHGTDHRSQICTALTALGVEPPGIDAWDVRSTGRRVVEVLPSSDGPVVLRRRRPRTVPSRRSARPRERGEHLEVRSPSPISSSAFP